VPAFAAACEDAVRTDFDFLLLAAPSRQIWNLR
jgi:hypothetical protein